jgi:hypothetical protein
MNPKILKEKQIFLFLSMFFGFFVSIQIFFESLCLSNPYKSLYVISYKCKYMLIHLNMLKLLQENNMFFSLFFFF